MAFGLTPAGSGFPPQAPDAFPNYIQFQYDGTDLGGPTVDTVDFQGSVFVSRGDGENANKITVVVGGNPSTPATGPQTMAFKNAGSGGGTGINAWSATPLVADASVAAYVDSTNLLTFASAGVYQVTVTTRATVGTLSPVHRITLSSPVGSIPDEWTAGANHYVDNTGGQTQFSFTDMFVLNMQAGDLQRSFQVTTDNAEESLSVSLSIVITKLS
jgi:hypothetical protein